MKDGNRFDEVISYRRLLSCLPRWILRTHTDFASFLARTFHIPRNGSSLASAIFPVPVPRVGLFRAQRVPKLSQRKWASLCAQRVLHVAVVAHNYIHQGMKPVPVSQLGRRPNSSHLAIYKKALVCHDCG